MRNLFLASLAYACLAVPGALAQQDDRLADVQARMDAPVDTTLPPVETLTCDQMTAEMMVAGQRMNSQLDPNFAANAQALQDQVQNGRAPARGTEAAAAEANRQRVNTIGGQVADATAGIDLQRMMALSDRFAAERCPTPQ